ncbi:MAG: Na/Pi cotransporter family protein [Firmicutes bacterium]|nr:Na/Pi cotransporter family protein [Bacillota bacterium]
MEQTLVECIECAEYFEPSETIKCVSCYTAAAPVSIFLVIFMMLGGLAIFLFALQLLSSGLQEVAGKKANRVLEILTSIPVVGMLVGAVITIVVQSSTLTTVMVVSFVNAAILNLKQAAAVIMGANIGTTLTGHLVAFNITSIWIYCAFIGFVIYFLAKSKNLKTIGQILFSFAILLLGLSLMSDAMRPLRTHEGFQDLIAMVAENRFLGMLVGLVFTAVVQSSTAVTGVIVLMTMEDVISIQAALALIVGANVGTCFTAVLASLSGTTAAKRAAAVHVIINLFGALVFLLFMPQFEWAVSFITPSGYAPRMAANAHTIFSVVIVAVFLPLINQLVQFVTFIIPERKDVDVEEVQKDTRYLDWKLTRTPAVAISLAQQELLYMADLAGQNIRLSIEGLLDKKKKKLRQMKRQEKLVDRLEKEIVRYLAAVSQVSLGKDMSIRHAGLLHAANDIERISDHARNIARSAKKIIDEDLQFPREASREIKDMYGPLIELYDTAVKSVRENDPTLAARIKRLKSQIDSMERRMRLAHIKRMVEGEINATDGIVFLEILSNLERIGDHSVNISHLPQGKL